MKRLSSLTLCFALFCAPIAADARGHGGHHGGGHGGHHGGGHHGSHRHGGGHSITHSFVHSVATGAGSQIGRDAVRSHRPAQTAVPASVERADSERRAPTAKVIPARAACPVDAERCKALLSASPTDHCAKPCSDLLRAAAH